MYQWISIPTDLIWQRELLPGIRQVIFTRQVKLFEINETSQFPRKPNIRPSLVNLPAFAGPPLHWSVDGNNWSAGNRINLDLAYSCLLPINSEWFLSAVCICAWEGYIKFDVKNDAMVTTWNIPERGR